MTNLLTDPFGQQVSDYYNGHENFLFVERDDGLLEATSGDFYFTDYPDWTKSEQLAIKNANGRILDIGCGPGRHAIYLQQKGFDITAIDSSSLIINVCKKRGIKNVQTGNIENLDELTTKEYDTILLMGNNLGLLQNKKKAPELLKKMYKITTDNAIIIAESSDPCYINDPFYQTYFKHNTEKGKLQGEVKIRIRYKNIIGPWFYYLYLSPGELKNVLKGTGWKLGEIFRNDSQYFAIIHK